MPEDAPSLSQKINLPKIISLNGKLNARLESEKRNFREWSILLDGESRRFKFKLPEEIANSGNNAKLSAELTINRNEIKSWRIEGDQSLVNFKGIELDGTIGAAYSVDDKEYILSGSLQLENKNNPFPQIIDLRKNATFEGDIRLKKSDTNINAKPKKTNWSIQGLSATTSFKLPIFGLGSLQAKNTKLNYEKQSTIKEIKNSKDKDTENKKADGRYNISGLKVGGKEGGLFGKGTTIPKLRFRVSKGELQPRRWKAEGKLNFNIPGIRAQRSDNVTVASTPENKKNNQGFTLKNFTIPGKHKFIKDANLESLEIGKKPNQNRWNVKSFSLQGDFTKNIPGLKIAKDISAVYNSDNKIGPMFSLKDVKLDTKSKQQIFKSGSIKNASIAKNNKIKEDGEFPNLILMGFIKPDQASRYRHKKQGRTRL